MDVKLTFKERFSYSLGSLACNLVWTSVGGFMVLFYTDIALLPAATVGILILISRIFDGVSDIGMGIIIDRSKHPKGKARPWILRMAIPFAIATFLCFNVFPEWPLLARVIYAFITYNILTTIVYTAVDIPYGVMNAAMSQDQYQRSVLNIFRLFMAIVAGVAVNMVVPRMTATLGGGGAQGWRLTFGLLGILAAIMFFLTYFNTKERVETSVTIKDNVPIKTGLKALVKNKYWIMVVIYAVMSYTSTGLGGIGVYFTREILGDLTLVGTITIIGVLPMLAGTFLIAPIVKKAGKRTVALIGIICGILGCIIILASDPGVDTSLTMFFVAVVIRAFGSAFIIGTLFAIIADTIEYGEWKSGVRTEGLVYSASSFGGKLGNGLGMAIVSLALSVGGYVPRVVEGFGPTGQSDATINAIRVVYLWIPIFLFICMGIIMFFFKLDKQYPAILAELKARRGEEA
ncbi:MAG: glycoside-pentoside-hexuronide (GPH):cation symporter [Treponema sp.]|nr:glycoside-pentoside-hexuronide (GPH):cation symporter [Treponema sp.]